MLDPKENFILHKDNSANSVADTQPANRFLAILHAIDDGLGAIIVIMKGKPGWAQFDQNMEKIRSTEYYSDIHIPLEKVKRAREIATAPEVKKDEKHLDEAEQELFKNLGELSKALRSLGEKVKTEMAEKLLRE